MADRTSAEIFGTLFEYIAKSKTPDMKLAKKMYGLSQNYDFSACQMEADDELIKLGLAKMGPDPYGDDEEIVLYLGEDYGRWPK